MLNLSAHERGFGSVFMYHLLVCGLGADQNPTLVRMLGSVVLLYDIPQL